MAHIIPGERAEKMEDLAVYGIVSPFAKEFYIAKTGQHRLRKAYAEHYGGRVPKTKVLFDRAKDYGCLPPLYVLEAGKMSQRAAFRVAVAWTKYFIDHGYSQITEDLLTEYSEAMVKSTQKIYDSIKDKPLSEVLQPEGGLFPDYNARRKNASGRLQVSFELEPESYDAIKKAAESEGLSMSAYCRQMAEHGQVIHFDSKPWFDFLEEYSSTKQLLRQILYTIYMTQRYYPADLANIQKSIDHLTELSKKSSNEYLNFMSALRHGGE